MTTEPTANPDADSLGPIELAPGVLKRHVMSYLFAAFLGIGMFTYLMSLTPYILEVNLGIPQDQHGRIIGNLQFVQEIVILIVIGWWGAISDRYGRRPIFVAGFLLMALAYGIYSFATSLPQLFALRMVFALAVAAVTTTLSAILADYPTEDSRGKMTGMAFLLNGLGAVAFFAGLMQLPDIFLQQGAEPIWAGHYAYLTVAALAFVASIVMFGLKPGRPDGVEEKTPILTLIEGGIKAARNKRIGVSYIGAFAARANMSITTLFLILWIIQAAGASGLEPAAAQARAGMFIAVSMVAAVISAPIFGILADKIDRLMFCVLTFGIAAIGYGWLGVTDNMLSLITVIPALVVVGIGQSSAMLAVTVLLGEEAPVNLRGSAFGVQSFFGALGILAISVGGGQLYDLVSPAAPFIAVAIANLLVVILGLACIFSERTTNRS